MKNHTTNKRILVVDDTLAIHDDFRKILTPVSSASGTLLELEQRLLHSPGQVTRRPDLDYTLDFASQGAEAIEMVKCSAELQTPYAVAFVDVRMPPGIDGIETISALWQIDPNLHAVVCTAYSDQDWHEIAQRLGYTDKLLILKKPFDPMELLQIATALTQKWRLERDAKKRLQDLEIEASETFKQLAHAQKMEAIGRLASGIAHDFNNLLTINLGYASVLLSREDLSEKARFCVEAMNDATLRAAGLTKQLLAFTRQQSSVPTLVSPNELISDMQCLLMRAIGESISLKLDLSDTAGTIKFDKTQLEQILLNLAINSRDAMSVGGTISISTSQISADKLPGGEIDHNVPRYFVFKVTDDGHGMSNEVKERIFEPFFTTKDAEHGTGLGLSTVYGIVQKNKGQIWVDSEVGVGTSFSIALPIDTSAVTELPEDTRPPREDRPRYVMVVDDEKEVRRVTLEMLKQAGFQVFEASGSLDALRHLADHTKTIDLVLTDVVMPKVTGIQLADTLNNAYPAIPIVFMSGHAKDAQFQKDVENGRKRFLQKPFTTESLLRSLQEALGEEESGRKLKSNLA